MINKIIPYLFHILGVFPLIFLILYNFCPIFYVRIMCLTLCQNGIRHKNIKNTAYNHAGYDTYNKDKMIKVKNNPNNEA